jgi:hypothetical protein
MLTSLEYSVVAAAVTRHSWNLVGDKALSNRKMMKYGYRGHELDRLIIKS